MAKYKVEAPNGSHIEISNKYGSFRFNHGSIIEFDRLAKLYPKYFKKTDEVEVLQVFESLLSSDQPSTPSEDKEIIEMFENSEIYPQNQTSEGKSGKKNK